MTSPQLSWLPERAADWTARVESIVEPTAEAWSALSALANRKLDGLATARLDRCLNKLFGAAPPPGLATTPVRLAVLASSTMDPLLPALRVGALRWGMWLTTYTCAYGQYAQELMDPTSGLHAFAPTVVLFALDARHLLGGFEPTDSAATADARLDGVRGDLCALWANAREKLGCRVVQQTLLPVFTPLFGNNEHRLPGSRAAILARLNARLRDWAESEGVDLLAIDERAAEDGARAWHDPVLWHRAKQEVHPSAAPVYGDLLARLLAARQGRARKCLVLDLDNTLWGGVIGDDGLEGIKLGQGSALGEAFLDVQHYARLLSRRGIILAVCSKNDEANALLPFEKHPEMVLRRDDIACFVANWSDKPANLRAIAARLNIGLDSLVFADDNPFERDIVRRELPMVAVPELPDDPAFYAATIAAAGYFEGVSLTAEDLERTRLYQENVARETLKSSATDIEGYLRGLDMEMRWSRFDRIGLQRVTQLINKTNQFNLTTRRTTEDEVAALIADERALTLQIRLLDRFGDNGIIAIIAGSFAPNTLDLHIDTWLMSCRVLGRGVEAATLNLIVAEAGRLGAKRLIGQYRPTEKNAMVRDHYATLGFLPLDADAEGNTRWTLSLDGFSPTPTFIRAVQMTTEQA